jgi:predicted nucleic-acid-binding Zn-ribbon protein
MIRIDAKDHDHLNGHRGCPRCSRHDHTDRRIIGADHGVPVKAWEVLCPHCGTTEGTFTHITSEGRALLHRILGERDDDEVPFELAEPRERADLA